MVIGEESREKGEEGMSEIEELKERIRLLERELELREKLAELRGATKNIPNGPYWRTYYPPVFVDPFPPPSTIPPNVWYGSGTGNLGAAYA